MDGPIGFIGLGIMGRGMVTNIITKLGAAVVVWNRTTSICDELAAQYSQVSTASTPKEVIERCGVTFCMLSNMEASLAVFEGDNGILSGVTSGKTIVDCATLTPERMAALSESIKARSGAFVEAPVSGSKGPAETGTLIFLCGGDNDAYEAIQPALNVMGKACYYFGPAGKGTEMKLIVNMIMGSMMSSFAEGLSLCNAANLSAETLLQVLDGGAMSNPMFRGKGMSMINGQYPANFPLKHAHKDMKYALGMAEKCGVELPTASAATTVFDSVLAKHGDDDFAAVMEAYPRKRNKKE